ncbi:beta-lactamase/transpeptidase-like protein [Athelia psychrophila]|uniref:Beta-lactamase/transpeptidase-like protein n=1 Tax=Athelia psychrophila TaxID=1759441 RepID=A0A166QLK2_9AGAM|nr:beta-lactamase/transpeptidase-like protein [Fibularhizoctonia sp. CBS 109695]
MSSSTLEETFRTAIDNKIIPGAVLVATNKAGTLNYAKAFGQTGVSPDATPLTLDSTFWIASCTKLLVTISALQCVERGLLSLDSPDDIARLLPEIAAPEILSLDATGTPITVPAKNRITLRQLLTHTAGLSYEFLDPRLATWRKSPAGRRAAAHSDLFTAKFLAPLVYEPGEAWMYSIGLDWVGKLVERANDGVTLEAYMQQHIWDPLGIQDITFHLEKKPRVKENLVEMTARVAESGLLIPAKNEYIPEKIKIDQGGGGLWGSAPEYLKVLASILRDDGKLVNSATVKEMFKPQLGPASQEAWTKILQVPATNAAFTGNAALSTEFSWGLGGKYSLEDMPEGRRKKGSLAWGGLPNLFWWIDPAAGVAGLYASQVIPSGDIKSTEMFAEFEKDIYKQAQAL